MICGVPYDYRNVSSQVKHLFPYNVWLFWRYIVFLNATDLLTPTNAPRSLRAFPHTEVCSFLDTDGLLYDLPRLRHYPPILTAAHTLYRYHLKRPRTNGTEVLTGFIRRPQQYV